MEMRRYYHLVDETNKLKDKVRFLQNDNSQLKRDMEWMKEEQVRLREMFAWQTRFG